MSAEAPHKPLPAAAPPPKQANDAEYYSSSYSGSYYTTPRDVVTGAQPPAPLGPLVRRPPRR